jgi:molybdopterin molybdotransferase
MGFRGEKFVFGSPAEAVSAMIARVGDRSTADAVSERVALEHAIGRVLARPVVLDRDSPAFDYSAMDGYAVRVADVARMAASEPSNGSPGAAAPPCRLPVLGESRIGREPPELPVGGAVAAIRIVTGAAIPPGADCVVRREDVKEHAMPDGAAGGADVGAISISSERVGALRVGDHIRRRGENARRGEVVLDTGSVIVPAGVGLLAAVGATCIDAAPRVRVVIITTGDELVAPEQAPGPFEVRNSNAPALRTILATHRWLEVIDIVHVPDEGPPLVQRLTAAASSADVVILTGGVSMGHRDPVRGAIERVGAQIIFHGLPQRPGKPMIGAIAAKGGGQSSLTMLIFGLPGNPLSAMVTCRRVVLPVLAVMAGARRLPPTLMPRFVRLANPDAKSLDLWWHRLAVLGGAGEARLLDGRGSGDLVAGGRSDGFVELAPGARPDADALVPFYSWV